MERLVPNRDNSNSRIGTYTDNDRYILYFTTVYDEKSFISAWNTELGDDWVHYWCEYRKKVKKSTKKLGYIIFFSYLYIVR